MNPKKVFVQPNAIRKTDVLSGRGNGVAFHEGNVFYSRLVRENKDKYQHRANSVEKKQIALGIIDIIECQDPPGRFLRQSKKSKEVILWVVENDSYAMKKVTQALREKRKLRVEKKSCNVPLNTMKKATQILEEKPAERAHEKSCNLSEEGKFLGCRRDSLGKRSMVFDSRQALIEHKMLDTDDNSQGDDHQEAYTNEAVTDAEAQVLNPNYRPGKKSLVGDSRRKMMLWMNSQSRLNLLRSSLHSLDVGSKSSDRSLTSPSPIEVRDGMEKLSSSDFDDLEEKLQNMGTSIEALAGNFISANCEDESNPVDSSDFQHMKDIALDNKITAELLKELTSGFNGFNFSNRSLLTEQI